jgi:foldase protein PrsA
MLAILLAAPLMLSACGGAASRSSPAPATRASDPAAQIEQGPSAQVIARVGGEPITRGAVQRAMALASAGRTPVPDPPAYRGCIARAKAEAGHAKTSVAELKLGCERSYRQQLQVALTAVIHNQWLIGEAAREGVTVSDREVQREYELSQKANFETAAEFANYLKKTGQTPADLRRELRIGKLADGIFTRIRRRQHPATQREVAQYYAGHKQQFTIPEGRNVRIIRTTTRTGALAAKRAIESGASFASVAKGLPAIAQPVRSKNGLVVGLISGFYSEPELNKAIFQAKRGQVYGPVYVSKPKIIPPEPASGYFVFEVVGNHPGHRRPFSAVAPEIAKALTEHKKNDTLAAAVKAFRQAWKAKTDCAPGYVIESCRQSKLDVAPSDPYRL